MMSVARSSLLVVGNDERTTKNQQRTPFPYFGSSAANSGCGRAMTSAIISLPPKPLHGLLTAVDGRLHGRHVAADDDRHVCRADFLLAHQAHGRAFEHLVGGVQGSHQALRFQQADRFRILLAHICFLGICSGDSRIVDFQQGVVHGRRLCQPPRGFQRRGHHHQLGRGAHQPAQGQAHFAGFAHVGRRAGQLDALRGTVGTLDADNPHASQLGTAIGHQQGWSQIADFQ